MKSLGLFVMTVAVVSCGNPLEPGTEWLAGSWRLANKCVGGGGTGRPDCRTVDNPTAQTLTLTTDGTAIVRELGLTVLSTDYRAGRETSEAGTPAYVRFEDEINFWREPGFYATFGSRLFALSSSTPTDSLTLSFQYTGAPYRDHTQSYLFVRTQ